MPRPISEETRQEWKQLIEQWAATTPKASALSWCNKNNINYHSFLYWRERLHSRIMDRSSFQELDFVQEPQTQTGIVLECNQIHIRLEENFDANTLRKCLQILKEDVC
jgi:hypothetical protein